MPLSIQECLILLLLLQIKHMFADFFLQTPFMLLRRGLYLHPGRALHCLIHIAGTALAFLIVSLPLGLAVILLVVEWLVHYHIDFGKGRWSDKTGHVPTDAGFWRAFGADQFLHQATYLAMLLPLV